MNQTTLTQLNWIFDTIAVQQLLQELGFRESVINYINQALREVAQLDDLSSFLDFCNSWQAYAKQGKSADYPATWQALAVVSSFPAAIEKHRERGVPWEITRATLADFQRDARGDYAREKAWEFNRLSWMRNHINGHFFEIGRLQYIPGKFGYQFRIYKNDESGEIISFALPGLKCTPQGWPCENATAFETTLEKADRYIVGYPALANGAISSMAQKIPAASKVLLDADSTVAIIHIPSGGKLDRDDCCQSLHDAKIFFQKYFPEIEIHAFCTATWLLDPELTRVLPDSNIASFGQLFHPLALINGNDHQLLERVFGEVEWEHCKSENSLQKAILNHHVNGGEFRSTAGFILPEEIVFSHSDDVVAIEAETEF